MVKKQGILTKQSFKLNRNILPIKIQGGKISPISLLIKFIISFK